MQIIDRILFLLKVLGFGNQTEFMRDLEMSHTTIGRWKKGNNIDPIVLNLIECKYNISRKWLREGVGNMFNENAIPPGLSDDEQILLKFFKQLQPQEKASIIAAVQEKHELFMLRHKSSFIDTQINMNDGDVNNIQNENQDRD